MGALAIYNIQHNKDTRSSEKNSLTSVGVDDVFRRPIIFDNNKTTYVSDDLWDFSAFSQSSKDSAVINFLIVEDHKNRSQIKKLMYLLALKGNGRNDSIYSINTLKSYFRTLLDISVYCSNKGISIQAFFENTDYVQKYIAAIKEHKINTLFNILGFLKNTKNSQTAINYKEDKHLIMYLAKRINNYNSSKNQTPVIPSRILSRTIKERWLQVDEIIEYLPNLLSFLENMLRDQKFASPDKSGRKSKWSKEVNSLNLDYLFSKYYIKEKKNIGKFISKIQGTCNHLIHAYSGMRKQEVFSLKNDCYREEKINGSICRLFGITTKMHGKSKEDYWVTSKEIKKVLYILNGINNVIAKHHKIKNDSLPLFIGTSMIKSNSTKGKIVAKYSFHDDEELPMDEEIFIISSQDKHEVEEIDFNRNYQEIEIGKKWQITTHQYRRSLAVYSIQSGLVTLGALQIQMKHLFREMTLYYSNGASFAKKLFDTPKDHISKDIETMKPELETLAYIKDVLYSDEKLYGAHGKFVENNTKAKNGDNFILFFANNRDKTLQLFKNGEIAYKNTALGGCISMEACDSRIARSTTACFDCYGGILKKSKVDNVIQKQKEFMEYLDKDSIEYRTEMDDLNKLEDLRNKLIKD